MLVYHGSTIAVEKPEIITSEIGRDFGFGFYTTDIKNQALRWARRKAILSKRKKVGAEATLNIYEYNESKAKEDLNIKIFNDPNSEWLDFIIACRSDTSFEHSYDIVVGNIANDNVGETVSFVMNGIMRKEDALERLKFQKINNQICFNTVKALGYLEFIKSSIVY